MRTSLIVVTLIIMFLGLAGTILPMLPGLVLIYAAFLFYGVATGWIDYGVGAMLLWGFVVLGSFVVDHVAGSIGARKYGASRYGFWGSFLGAFAGLLIFNLPGLVIGAFLGAFCGELLAGKSGYEALRSGKGALIGLLAGTLFKVAVGLVMIGTFLYLVLT